MTPRRSKVSTCSLIAVCILLLWCQGGSRLRETSLSTTILIGPTLADWCLTLIKKAIICSSQSFLGIQQNLRNESLVESRCSDHRDNQMDYFAIRCHHHSWWNPAHHLFSTRSNVSSSWKSADGMTEQHTGPSSGSGVWSDLVIHMESSPTSIPIYFACDCWHLGCAHEWHIGVDAVRASWMLWQRNSTSSKYERILRTRWWDLITAITFALTLIIISFNSLIS